MAPLPVPTCFPEPFPGTQGRTGTKKKKMAQAFFGHDDPPSLFMQYTNGHGIPEGIFAQCVILQVKVQK